SYKSRPCAEIAMREWRSRAHSPCIHLKDDTSEADWLPADARIQDANEDPVIDCRRDSTPGGQYPGDDEQRVQEWPSRLVRAHCQHPAPCEDRAQLEVAFGGMAWMPPCSPRCRICA